MSELNKFLAFIGGCLCLACFLIPSINWYEKLLIIAVLIVVYLIISYIELFKKYKQTKNNLKDIKDELKDINNNHGALSKQFDESINQLEIYKNTMNNVELQITIAVLSTEKDRLRALLDAFLFIKSHITNGGN